jgi:hypothetical protein
MANPISARIRKLESAVPDTKPYRRVLRVVASNREDADQLARECGFHPGEDCDDELIISRILVSPPGKVHAPIKPYVLRRTGGGVSP